jgi:triphosphoribosyl-dephospho-CoA synthase
MTPGMMAQVACVLEVTARKVGNVHRFADFEDTTYLDFILSAAAIRPAMDRAREIGVGAAVLEAVRATRAVVRTNTNLGLILLMAPIAAIPDGVPTREGLEAVLNELTVEDSRLVYAAIRLARPAGLGEAAAEDVKDEPTRPLREIMGMAAERDLVARQYANGYEEVRWALDLIEGTMRNGWGLEEAIMTAQLGLLQDCTDTLVARKRGETAAAEVRERVTEVLGQKGKQQFSHLDDWLRAERHARNPGAIADVVGGGIAWAIRDRIIGFPLAAGAFLAMRATAWNTLSPDGEESTP